MRSLDGLRRWLRAHPFRSFVYVCVGTVLATLLVVAILICRRGDGWLTRLVNLRTTRAAAERLGVRYRFTSLSVGCFQDRCRFQADASGAGFELLGQVPIRIEMDRFHGCLSHPVSIQGIRVATGEAPHLVEVGSAEVNLAARTLHAKDTRLTDPSGSILVALTELRASARTQQSEARGIRIPSAADPADSLAEVQSVSTSGLTGFKRESAVRIEEVKVNGVDVAFQDGAWDRNRTRSLVSAGAAIGRMSRAALDGAGRLIGRARRVLFWILAVSIAAAVILKLAVTFRLAGFAFGLVLAAVPVVLSYALYYGFAGLRPVRLFVLVASAAVLTVAAALWLFIYRRGAEWHQRWEPVAVDLVFPPVILLLLVAYRYPISLPGWLPSEVRIAAVEVREAAGRLRDAACAGADLGQLTAGEATVKDVRVVLDPPSYLIRTVEASAAFRGLAGSSLVSSELQRLEFLGQEWKDPQPAGVCVNFTLTGPGVPPRAPPACAPNPSHQREVAIGAAVALDPAALAFRTDVNATVRAPALHLRLKADGDSRLVRVREVSSLPGSRFEVAGGTGTVSLERGLLVGLQLRKLGTRLAAAHTSVESAELRASVPSFCSPANMRFAAGLRRVAVDTDDGSTSRADRVAVDFLRGQGPVEVRAQAQEVDITAKRSGEAEAWLSAGIPLAKIRITGRTTAGWIPERIIGDAALVLSQSAESPALWTEAPVKWSADVWRGRIEFPGQDAVLRQSIVPQAPETIPVWVFADSRLEPPGAFSRASADVKLKVPRLEPDIRPLRAQLNNLELEAQVTWARDGLNVQASFKSGWNSLAYPTVPRAFQIQELATLDLKTEGQAPSLPLDDSVLRGWEPAVRSVLAAFPGLPPEVQLEGEVPERPAPARLRIQQRSGAGIAIGELTGKVQRVRLPSLRLEKLELSTEASHIRTLDGRGDLGFRSAVAIAGDTTDISAAIFLPGGERLGARLCRVPDRLDLRLSDEFSILPFWRAAQPFLQHFGAKTEGVGLGGQVTSLNARAQFSGADLTGLDMELGLRDGPLLSLDTSKILPPEQTGFFETVQVSLDPQRAGSLAMTIAVPASTQPVLPATIDARARGLDVLATDKTGEQHRLALDLEARSRILFHRGDDPPPDPIIEKARPAVADLTAHLRKAIEFFHPERAKPEIRDLRWKVDLANQSSQTPLLAFSPEKLSVGLKADLKEVAWRMGRQQELSIDRSKIDLAMDLAMHEGRLVADGYAPLDLRLVTSGTLARRRQLQVPFLVSFEDRLQQPADEGSDLLWDAPQYETFWSTYRPVHAGSGPVSVVNEKELLAGPASVQQLIFPTEALHMAVGHRGRLQIHLPFGAQVLFGRADGLVQADVEWLDRQPSIGGRVFLNLRDIQARAVGLAAPEGHVPLLEDAMDGEIAVRADGWLADAMLLNQLDRVDIKVELRSAAADRPAPGILQLGTDTRLDALNRVLNQIIRRLQLLAPPRTLSYDRFSFTFQAFKGEVQTKRPLVELHGLKVFSNERLELESNLRLHLGREDDRITLRDLVHLFQANVGATGGNGNGPL